MANYMYLFKGGQEFQGELTGAEKQKSMEEWGQWVGALAAKGKFKSGEPLNPQGWTIEKKGGELITDGPFTEAKEMVGGYLIVEAESLQSALEMAKGCPGYKAGVKVEVREIMSM